MYLLQVNKNKKMGMSRTYPFNLWKKMKIINVRLTIFEDKPKVIECTANFDNPMSKALCMDYIQKECRHIKDSKYSLEFIPYKTKGKK